MERDESTKQSGSRLRAILRLAGSIVLAVAGLTAVVAAMCWFAGWQISSGLTWAGVAAVTVGLLSTVGGWGLTRDPQYMYAQSVSHQDVSARTRQALGDSLRSYNFAIIATATGILGIALGTLF